MKYKIKYLKELRFEYSNHDHDSINESNVILNTSFKESYDNSNNELSIFLHVIYGLQMEEKVKQLVHCDIIMAFEFKSLPKSKKGKIEKIKSVFPNLLGITISSMRGVIYSRTKGEPINEFYLPIINPTSLIEEKSKEEPLQITLD